MIEFFMKNWGTLLVTAILLLIISVIIIVLVKDKKKGKSSCGCSCCDCAMKGSCHTKKQQDKE